MTVPPSFFLIWNPGGATPPRVRHATLGDAMVEATRLARNCPGQEFIVLETVRRVVVGQLSVTEYRMDEDMRIPF